MCFETRTYIAADAEFWLVSTVRRTFSDLLGVIDLLCGNEAHAVSDSGVLIKF